MTNKPSFSTYPALRSEIVQILQAGKDRARQAVEREKVQTYWEVGRVLHTHLLTSKDRANYGEQVVVKLAEDVGIRERLLYEMMQFHQSFPILRTFAELGWGHYCALLSVRTQAKRDFYVREASGGGWSVRELKAKIQAEATEKGQIVEDAAPRPEVGPPLQPKRGRLYTYRVAESPGPDGKVMSVHIDLGFGLYYSPAWGEGTRPDPGKIVEAVQEEGERYRFRVSRGGQERLHTYRAAVEEVVDGDTIWMRVDCGFRAWTRQKLRLRGIDAPEVPTVAGRRARDFVTQALSDLPFVVVTTTKPDKYDRYLSDLFYLRGGTDPQDALSKGVFLNQQLLDQGLAVRFSG